MYKAEKHTLIMASLKGVAEAQYACCAAELEHQWRSGTLRYRLEVVEDTGESNT